MTRMPRYALYAVTYGASVIVCVLASFLIFNDFMPGLPLGVLVGILVGTIVSYSLESRKKRAPNHDRKSGNTPPSE